MRPIAVTMRTKCGAALECILHIGTEKTGTTLLQGWLDHNRAALAEAGLALSLVAGRGNNRRLVMALLASPDGLMRRMGMPRPGDFQAKYPDFESNLKAEMKAAKDNGAARFLFSSEHFHSRLTTAEELQALKRMLAPFVSRFRILVYLREQSDLRRSLYSTALRKGFALRPEAFQPDIEPASKYYNYADLLDRWANVFGHDAIEPVVYSAPAFANGDIRSDFLTRVAPDLNHEGLQDGPLPERNAAFCFEAAQLAFAFNVALPGPDFIQVANQRRAKVMQGLSAAQGPMSRLVLPGGQDVMMRFAPSNLDMAKRYLSDPHPPFPPATGPDDCSDWTLCRPGNGARLRAMVGALDGAHNVGGRIDELNAQGGALEEVSALFAAALAPAAPAKRRRGGLFGIWGRAGR